MDKIIIIGAGPAGVSAAIYLHRFGLDVSVFNNNKSNLFLASDIENYYGISSISGRDLYQKGLEQLAKFNIKVIDDEVLGIEYLGNFLIKTKENQYEAKYLILATGLAKNTLHVKGLKELEGKGVSYCAICDSFFYRKKHIGIVGSSDYMLEELAILERVTNDITIFSNEEAYQNDKHNVINGKIEEIVGKNQLEGVKVAGAMYNLDGLFIANGTFNTLAITKHLGIALNEKGEVLVDSNYMTNVTNCYAIGDMIPGIKQVVIAASDGAKLAYHLFKKMKGDS